MNHLGKIKHFFENLSVESVENLNDIYEESAFFKDPFNELNSLDMIKKVFNEMFDELDRPHFIILDEIFQNNQIFLTWNFIFYKNNKEFQIHGSSHLKISTSGKILYHRDYWDVGEELLLKIPLVKSLYSILRNKISVD